MSQLSLELPIAENFDPYKAEDFLLFVENSAAFNFLEKFFAQKKFSLAQFPSLILRGDSKSGKTHLLNVFAKKYDAEFLSINEISEQQLSSIFVSNNFYILEDIDEIKNEELLFHLINAALAAKAFLLLSSKNKTNFSLKDLTSRIRNIFVLEIKNPSQETIKILLVKLLAKKQLRVSREIIETLIKNMDRSYKAVSDSVSMIESYCQENGKNITIREIKKILFSQVS